MTDFDSWTCVMVKKGPGIIPEDIRQHLQFVACDLSLKKHERMRIDGDGPCNGWIETEYKSYNIGTRSGIMFYTHVDGEDGEYQINFMLSEEDLKNNAKKIQKFLEEKGFDSQVTPFTEIPHEEFLNFRDLKRTRLGKSIN